MPSDSIAETSHYKDFPSKSKSPKLMKLMGFPENKPLNLKNSLCSYSIISYDFTRLQVVVELAPHVSIVMLCESVCNQLKMA